MFEKKRSGRHSKCPPAHVLNDLYVTQNLTTKEIGKKYGVSYRTVEGWIYQARKAERLQQQKRGD